MAERIFGGKGSYEKYSLVERRNLDSKVKEFKQQYLQELEALKDKTYWDDKRKSHVPAQPLLLLLLLLLFLYFQLTIYKVIYIYIYVYILYTIKIAQYWLI